MELTLYLENLLPVHVGDQRGLGEWHSKDPVGRMAKNMQETLYTARFLVYRILAV